MDITPQGITLLPPFSETLGSYDFITPADWNVTHTQQPSEEDKFKLLVFGKIRKNTYFDQYLSQNIENIWKLTKCIVILDTSLLQESTNAITVHLSDKFFDNNLLPTKRRSNAYLNLLSDFALTRKNISEDDSVRKLSINTCKLGTNFKTRFWKIFLCKYRFLLGSNDTILQQIDGDYSKYCYFKFYINVHNITKNSVIINPDEADSKPSHKKIKLENEDVSKKQRHEKILYPSYYLTINVNGKNILEEKITVRSPKSNLVRNYNKFAF